MKPYAFHLTALVLAVSVSGCVGEERTVDLSPGPAAPAATPIAAAQAAAAPAAASASLAPPAPSVVRPDTGAVTPDVRASDAQPFDVPPESEAIPGILVADRKAAIGSQLTGQVAAVLVREGDRVMANQPVLRLDDHELLLEVASAAAALEAARRRLTSGATGTHVTANDVDQLVTQAEGSLQVALAKWDSARSAFDFAGRESAAEIAAARAQLDAAQARLARLRNGSRPQEVAEARAHARADEAALTRAADEAKRLQELFRQGAVSEQSLVAAQSEQRRLEAELARSQEQLALVEAGSRPEEIQEAEAQQRAAQAQLQVAGSSRQHVEQQRAELAAARAEVAHLQAALRVARDSRVRVSRSRQDTEALAEDVRLAAANLALARERLSETVLRSPIAGQVTLRQVQPGDSVQADQRRLLEVTDSSSLHVEIVVAEAQVPRLRVGMPVWVELPSQRRGRIPGRIESVSDAPRGTTLGYVGRVRLSRVPPQARAGMLANVYLR